MLLAAIRFLNEVERSNFTEASKLMKELAQVERQYIQIVSYTKAESIYIA